MSNLKYVSGYSCEKGFKNHQFELRESSKAKFSVESYRSLQNFCPINLPGLRRKS